MSGAAGSSPGCTQRWGKWAEAERDLDALISRANVNQMIQLGIAYKGTAGFLGWGGVAPTLGARHRAAAAYLLGLRFVSLKDRAEAANFFRTAIQDAAPESRLRRLAQAELDRLMKNSCVFLGQHPAGYVGQPADVAAGVNGLMTDMGD